MTAADLDPLPRCCASHTDWRTLAEHLVAEFTELSAGEVVRELGRAKEAVETFNLSDDPIQVAELMARQQLMLLAGRVPDIARLDPERHVRGGRDT